MRRGGGSMIAALILTCLFAMTMLLTLVMGAKVYRGVQQRVDDSAARRVGVSYITAKIHANDHADGVSVQKFGGADAVILAQDYDGERYQTALYVYDGQLMELFCGNLDDFSPAEGTPIVEAQQMTAQMSDDGLEIVYTDAGGRTQTAYINLRSEVDSRAGQ